MSAPAFQANAFDAGAFETAQAKDINSSFPTFVPKIASSLVYSGIHGFMGRSAGAGARKVYVSTATPPHRPFTKR